MTATFYVGDAIQNDCTCVPCTHPAFGFPGMAHCAACCYGTLIEEYHFDCQIPEHREMAALQFPGSVPRFA